MKARLIFFLVYFLVHLVIVVKPYFCLTFFLFTNYIIENGEGLRDDRSIAYLARIGFDFSFDLIPCLCFACVFTGQNFL